MVPIRPVFAEPLEYSLFDFVLAGASLLAQGTQNVRIIDSSRWQDNLNHKMKKITLKLILY